MILTKRERNIAIGVAAAALLFALDQYLLSPYFDQRKFITDGTTKAQVQWAKGTKTLNSQRKLKPVWADIIAGGLKTDASDAESQALNAVREWAQDAGVILTALKPERASQEGKFQVISFHVTGTGPMRAISRLTWAMETAPIPVRVNDLQLTPRKEGTDDLQVQMSVSTLSVMPGEAEKPDRRGAVSRADFGGRP